VDFQDKSRESAAPVDAAFLQQTIIQEAFWVMGISDRKWLRRLLEPLFRPIVGRFARLAAGFENDVAQIGMRQAIRARMDQFVEEVDITGEGSLPAAGPLLIVANHPAAYDFFLIAATLPRDDLKLIASNINILRRLPATSEHFIFTATNQNESVTGDTHSRMSAVRASVRQLKGGGALMVFPSGRVDPDPAVSPEGALEALSLWSPSIELFLRKAPETKVVVSIVSGVLSPGWYHSPVTWLRKEPHNKQKVAEIFQVMQQLLFPNSLKLRPTISFSRPLTVDELKARDPDGILPALTTEARSLTNEARSLTNEARSLTNEARSLIGKEDSRSDQT